MTFALRIIVHASRQMPIFAAQVQAVSYFGGSRPEPVVPISFGESPIPTEAADQAPRSGRMAMRPIAGVGDTAPIPTTAVRS